MAQLESYNIIKVNPSPEIWLKSKKVKIRWLKALMNNIKNSLKHAKIPFHKYQLSKDSARIFFFFNSQYIINYRGDRFRMIQIQFFNKFIHLLK